MQWCQGLDADYGVDPWIWQSLHGPSFYLSSKLGMDHMAPNEGARESTKEAKGICNPIGGTTL